MEQLPIFVYGTLRPGEKNYRAYLGGRTLAEIPASVRGELYFVEDGGYPYLVDGAGRVEGELVILVPEDYAQTLEMLDALEEYDPNNEAASVYLRRQGRVRLTDGTETDAWTYYWNCPQVVGRKIPSGDFRKREAG
ncbi:gamma-glutamylcyclotransferase family protein [Geoalkalibacter sp.]|uniref:gamma-glutamylcyclotransferase family protein n=1 Tax=Geoalkalibacter sp. TaxID=3041440 RepID=UPI00272E0875|nr:gamma-glutamylcyclotransferase family protein [Geoalkalibacter sp.]